MLIEIFNLNVNHNNRIGLVVGGNHSEGAVRFPMKLIYRVINGNIFERASNYGRIYCWKDNRNILKNTRIMKCGESFKILLLLSLFNNHLIPLLNTYIIDGLNFLVIFLEKEHYSPKWFNTYKLHSKEWVKIIIYIYIETW